MIREQVVGDQAHRGGERPKPAEHREVTQHIGHADLAARGLEHAEQDSGDNENDHQHRGALPDEAYHPL